MVDFTGTLRLEVETARSDVFVWGLSTWSGYRFGGPADTATSGTEWLNVLGETHEIKVRRGGKANGFSFEIEAGDLQATVLDPQVDPSSSPYIKPGTPIRLMHDEDAVFTGELRQVKVTYHSGQPRVFLSAIDRVKDLANTMRYGADEGTFTNRVVSLLGKHGYDYRVYGDSATMLARNNYDSTVLNHLTLATTSEQGRWFVCKHNHVHAFTKTEGLPAATYMFTDKRTTGGYAPEPMNGTFDVDTSGWHSSLFGEPLGTIARDTAVKRSGSASLRLTTTRSLGGGVWSGTAWNQAVTTLIPGARYRIGAWVYLGTGVTSAQLVAWFDSGFEAASTTKTGEWVHLTAEDVPTRNVLDLAVEIRGASASAQVWVDDVTVERVLPPIEYVDIGVSYDSDKLVNEIVINNLTYDVNEENEPLSVSTKYGPYRNGTSIATYGVFNENIDTNLPPANINAYAVEALAKTGYPELHVSNVRANMSQTTDVAAAFEVYDSVGIEYENEYVHINDTYTVLSIEHEISASNTNHKWMTTLELNKLGGN